MLHPRPGPAGHAPRALVVPAVLQGRPQHGEHFGGIGAAIGFEFGLSNPVLALGTEQHNLVT